ncbi:hypothetical protein A9Q83_08425 [Alphaproteobacteria bacterium 46_93_T64]|nr:hypothetical protein A9Q83_08425 [Alphaproteobacteria bacterium 46_93_T64]
MFLVVLFPSARSSAKTVELTFSQISGSPVVQAASEVISHLYKRIGITANFLPMPARRALEMSNGGKTDGEIFRVKSIGKKFKNLVRVPTPLLKVVWYAYAANERLAVGSQEEIKKVNRIGIIRGVVWAENLVKNNKAVVRVDNISDLAEKLIMGAIDVAVATDAELFKQYEKRKLKKSVFRGSPLHTINLYHYLYKKHANLVPIIDAEIKKMIAVNEISKIMKEFYMSKK